jgi:hypothetical protein
MVQRERFWFSSILGPRKDTSRVMLTFAFLSEVPNQEVFWRSLLYDVSVRGAETRSWRPVTESKKEDQGSEAAQEVAWLFLRKLSDLNSYLKTSLKLMLPVQVLYLSLQTSDVIGDDSRRVSPAFKWTGSVSFKVSSLPSHDPRERLPWPSLGFPPAGESWKLILHVFLSWHTTPSFIYSTHTKGSFRPLKKLPAERS